MPPVDFPHGMPWSGEDAGAQWPPCGALSAAESQAGRWLVPLECASMAEAAAVDAADAVAVLAERKVSRTGCGTVTARRARMSAGETQTTSPSVGGVARPASTSLWARRDRARAGPVRLGCVGLLGDDVRELGAGLDRAEGRHAWPAGVLAGWR